MLKCFRSDLLLIFTRKMSNLFRSSTIGILRKHGVLATYAAQRTLRPRVSLVLEQYKVPAELYALTEAFHINHEEQYA